MGRSRRSRRAPAAPPLPAAPPPPPAPDEPFLRAAIAIALVALAIRIVHVWQIRNAPFFTELMGDSRAYDEWARQIAAGDWVGHDVFYQAPLYPYFLGLLYSVLGRSLLAVRLCQAVVGAGSCVLIGLAARRLFSARTGLIAGLALALYAPAIFSDALIQKSVLDAFFTCLTIWLVAVLASGRGRRRTWLGLGLAVGALSLTRENALALVAVVAVWAIVSSGHRGVRRLVPAAVLIAGLALVLLPVAFRNQMVGGEFFLTTSQFGPNFYIGNNPRADGTYVSLKYGRGSPEYEREDATDLADRATGRRLTPAEVSSYWTDQALAYIGGHPGAWLALMARKFALLWNADEMLDTESQATYAEWSLPLRVTGYVGNFGVLVPLALFGLIVTWDARRRLAIVYALIVVYAGSVLLFYVFARYRFPLVPFLILFAAEGGRAAWSFMRQATPRTRSVVLAALAVTAVFVNWPILSAATMQAITETNLGAALEDDGRYQEAIDHYRRALTFEADYSPAYNNMGTAFRASHHADEAIDAFDRALTINPDYADAHYNLANTLVAAGRLDEAIAHFRRAAELEPGWADVHNNLGIALSDAGHTQEAIAELQQALRLDPESEQARLNLGKLLASSGSAGSGIDELRRAVALNPNDAGAHYDLGSTLLDAGKFDEAEAEFREALRLQPESVEAMNNLGIALGSQGRLDEAIAQFQHALAIKPDFGDAEANLARAEQARRRAPAR